MKTESKAIIELEKDVYLVRGRIIKAVTPGMFDYDGGHAELLEIAASMDSQYWAGPGKDELAVCGFFRLENDPDGATSGFGSVDPVSSLFDGAKDILRREMPEYEDRF